MLGLNRGEVGIVTEIVRSLLDGEVLFREGDSADCAYIVDAGRLQISTHSESGDVILCRLGAGEIVGEMGVIDGSPRTATAIAVGETRLIIVTQNQFTERISQADSILRLLVNILLERYRSGLTSVKRHHQMDAHAEISSDRLVGEYVRHGIDKIRLESELKDALAKRDLQVLYQPILNVASRTIAGFEALTRWEHPTRGQISPALFIALAEETNLIVPVGLYVLERACEDVAVLQKANDDSDDPLYMSINVSARQIADPGFLAAAVAVAESHDLETGLIRLEITEGLALDLDQTIEWVQEARSLGFKLALDDFGTGFSSLDTMHRVTADVAKIDRAFVIMLEEGPRSRDLFRGIVSMLKSLGLQIVVEGIETQGQLEFVWALDCDYAQGYLISPAIPLNEVLELVRNPPELRLGNLSGK